jgi:hypothetical protein
VQCELSLSAASRSRATRAAPRPPVGYCAASCHVRGQLGQRERRGVAPVSAAAVVSRGERLRVEVEDTDPVIRTQRGYGIESSTGRGLALVAAIAQEHGIIRTDTGKIAWFALDATPEEGDEPDVDALFDAWSDEEVHAASEPERAERTVTLAGLPPTLWLAAHQMHDALLRELALFRTGRDLDTGDLAAADLARFAVRGAIWTPDDGVNP